MAVELIREKVYQRLNQELPYTISQDIESWRKRKDGSVHIKARVWVNSTMQIKMVIGSGGQVIAAIRQETQKELEDLLKTKVYLKLEVKKSK